MAIVKDNTARHAHAHALQEAISTEAQLRLRVEGLDSELTRAVRERHLTADREETLRQRLGEREEAWRLQVCACVMPLTPVACSLRWSAWSSW